MTRRRSLGTFRLHLMLTAGLVVLSFASIAAVLTFVPLLVFLAHTELDSAAGAELSAYFIQLHESFWPMVVGAVIASITSGMVLFERMRSPLVRFASAYRRLAEGDTPEPIRLRALDYLKDEADELNRMLETMRRRHDEERSRMTRIEQTLCELEACELEPKAAAAIAEIRDALAPVHRHAPRAE